MWEDRLIWTFWIQVENSFCRNVSINCTCKPFPLCNYCRYRLIWQGSIWQPSVYIQPQCDQHCHAECRGTARLVVTESRAALLILEPKMSKCTACLLLELLVDWRTDQFRLCPEVDKVDEKVYPNVTSCLLQSDVCSPFSLNIGFRSTLRLELGSCWYWYQSKCFLRVPYFFFMFSGAAQQNTSSNYSRTSSINF